MLDLDLDFFLFGTDHWRDSAEDRQDAEEFPPWPLDDVMVFLTEQCGLDGRRPGFTVEHHNELFYLWGEAIEAGRIAPRLDVVHVDAHADLGLGDASYAYLMNELVFEPIEERYEILKRRRPRSRKGMLNLSNHAVSDGNWLMFSLACGWISDLTYVFLASSAGRDKTRPGDLPRSVMQDFDVRADHLQISGTREEAFHWAGSQPKVIEHRDPPVPFTTSFCSEYEASNPFDLVCLTRSPPYTPVEADPIFDAIRERFIDEGALS